MPEIKLLNSFKSAPVDTGNDASVKFSTGLRKFTSHANITSDSKSDIQR